MLQDSLDASFPGKSEILRLALSGRSTDEVVQVVQAVMNAYKDEITSKESAEKSERLNKLRLQKRNYANDLKLKLDKIQTLAEEIGTTDSQLAQVEHQIQLDRYRNMERKTLSLRDQAEELQAQIYIAQSSANGANFKPHQFDVDMMLERDPEYMEAKMMLDMYDDQMASMQGMVKGGPTVNRMYAERANIEQK